MFTEDGGVLLVELKAYNQRCRDRCSKAPLVDDNWIQLGGPCYEKFYHQIDILMIYRLLWNILEYYTYNYRVSTYYTSMYFYISYGFDPYQLPPAGPSSSRLHFNTPKVQAAVGANTYVPWMKKTESHGTPNMIS